MSDEFSSSLATDFEAFLDFKRALGISYRRAEFSLRAFDRFLIQSALSGKRLPLDHLMLAWLGRQPARKPVSVACELAVLRGFYAFLQRRGHRGLTEPAWPHVPAKSDHVPHVFSKTEVLRLLRLASGLSPPFRGLTYRTLLILLYCTGLRFGEPTRLRLRDLDLARGVIFVAASKGRARWVPYHPSLADQLRRYVSARRAFAAAGLDDPLFVSTTGTRLSTGLASGTVVRLLRAAGLKPPSGRLGPRPYDLRHTFAVHRLTRWYRAGVDLHARLPWLSAFMGHDDLLGTESYLTATPELLALAGERFHRQYLGRSATES